MRPSYDEWALNNKILGVVKLCDKLIPSDCIIKMMRRFANVIGSFKYKFNAFRTLEPRVKVLTGTTTNFALLSLLIWSVWHLGHRMVELK
jgi:hypothetical protein